VGKLVFDLMDIKASPGTRRNDALQALLRANALDPHRVAALDPLVIDEDAQTLTATYFLLNAAGEKYVDADRARGLAKEQRTVSLVSHPREHDLA